MTQHTSGNLALRVEGLTHRYGRQEALSGISLTIPQGAVYGLLGPNGSGKSTTIRLLLGLLRRQTGTVDVLGHDPARDPVAVKRAVGYVAEDHGFYPWMRVGELLAFVAHYRPEWDVAYAEHLCTTLGIERGPRIRELSKGQRAMVALLLALAFRPRLLLLDEPTASLDPHARRRFLEGVLGEYQEDGGTVLISSHLIHEIAGLVDHVGILDRGRLIVSAPLEDLASEVRRYRAVFEDTPPPADLACPGLVHRTVSGRQAILTVRGAGDHEVRAALAERGAARVDIDSPGLEEIFLALTGNEPLDREES